MIGRKNENYIIMREIGALLDNLISRIFQHIFPIRRMDKLQINFLITGEYFKTNF